MILKATIAAKVKRRGDVQISRVLHVHLFQYLDSETRRAISAEIMRETVASAPPEEITPAGICIFEIMAIVLMLRLEIFPEYDIKYSQPIPERIKVGVPTLSLRLKGGDFFYPEPCFPHAYGLFGLYLKSL